MISKERLEELIKEEKGCYILANAYTIGYIHLNKRYEPIIETNEDGYNLWVFTSNEYDFRDCIHDYSLFETKEEAEWYLEFGNITRTETLKLPTYKQVCDMIYSSKVYKAYGSLTIKTFDKITFRYMRQIDDNICLFIDRLNETQYLGSLTKENYIKACKLCKKLFLGETK